ncbi:MAG: dipeptide epimerase [candidate division KSB1 bacterium]|nr:dipeptide epimerase [candidate division KSB1 bacterium]MDZ7318015.1 dipeptide epimerase [candidate division KSB1 bacterium]MDZ7341584.1 dipeptide epimerase [candidate division KSB1 bacterium]
MKIVRVECWEIELKLREPYAIAYDRFDTARQVFLRLETDVRINGFGCAAPDAHVTGETPGSVLQVLKDVAEPMLHNADPMRWVWLLERLAQEMNGHAAALAAVDMALHDILAKVGQLPLWKLLGGYRERMLTSVTIGILPEAETVAKAKDLVRQGFKRLKLKGGLDVESDIVRAIKVREAVGEEIGLCFDANQGFTLEAALHFLEHTQAIQFEFIEQPLPREQTELLGFVKKQARTPVMADESLITLADLKYLVRHELVNLINLKLQKVGGIAVARKMIAGAEMAGIPAMVGCMDEAALPIAAGLHFALAQPNVRYADLDGHFDLLGDPTHAAILFHDGFLIPNDQPGLGWNPRE